jgi:hypothetical protein
MPADESTWSYSLDRTDPFNQNRNIWKYFS